MSNYIKRAVYKGQNDVVYENYVHNSVDKINKFPLVSAEETRRALILESFGDFDRELCLAAKERLEQLLDSFDTPASAPPSVEASAPPRIGKHMAEQQYLYCIGIINKAIDDSVTNPAVAYCHKMIVHNKLAERLAEHYSANGFTFSVESHDEDLSEIKISLW